MHLSTNFGKEIREKKSPGTNGLICYIKKKLGIYDYVQKSDIFWVFGQFSILIKVPQKLFFTINKNNFWFCYIKRI